MGVNLKFEDYTVAWIAVLPIEAEAALGMLDKRHERQFVTVPGDDYIYIGGEINRHNVVIATLPEGQNYGVGAAAALVNQVKARFSNIWFTMLVGVAAGLPNLSPQSPAKYRDIRLGDVLVAVPENGSGGIIQYDLGKYTEDGFLLVGRQAEPPAIIRSAIRIIKVTKKNPFKSGNMFSQYLADLQEKDDQFLCPSQLEDRLFEGVKGKSKLAPKLVRRNPRPELERTQVWYGNIGSGNSLMRDVKRRDELRDKYDLIGLEMEAAGVQTLSQLV
jgi:nucleoside phosphorylase